MCCSFPRKLYRLSGFVCVHIRRSNLWLSHPYIDLCCGECYYSCLWFVLFYVSVCVENYLLNAFAIMCGWGDCFICESYCFGVMSVWHSGWCVCVTDYIRDQLTFVTISVLVPECGYILPVVSIEYAMLVTCWMQCAMSDSILLLFTACVPRSVHVSPRGIWAVITLR